MERRTQTELFPDPDGYAPANSGQAPQPASGGASRGFGNIGGKVFSLAKFLKSLLGRSGEKGKIYISSTEALDLAINYLGNGYGEVFPGRFVSADGTRQVRMEDHDLACKWDAAHINFDVINPCKTVHVYIYDDGGIIR